MRAVVLLLTITIGLTACSGAEQQPVQVEQQPNVALDPQGRAELEALGRLMPGDIKMSPLCGNNGPEYDRAMAEQHAAFNAVFERYLQRPDAGEQAVHAIRELTDLEPTDPTRDRAQYEQMLLQYAALCVIARLEPEGAEDALEQSLHLMLPRDEYRCPPLNYKPGAWALGTLEGLQSEQAYLALHRLEESMPADSTWRVGIQHAIVRLDIKWQEGQDTP